MEWKFIYFYLKLFRETERGLVAYNCYRKFRRASRKLSLITIMVRLVKSRIVHPIFFHFKRGLLAPKEIEDVDVRAVQKKVGNKYG